MGLSKKQPHLEKKKQKGKWKKMPGAYIKVVYLADDFASKYAITIQPETKTLTFDGQANPDGGNDYIGRPIIVSSGSRRSRQPVARMVAFKFTSTAPAGYKVGSIMKLPWLRLDYFDRLVAGKTGTYQGFAVSVVGRYNEKIRKG